MIYSDFPGGVDCPAGFYYCLSSERWDEIRAFADATGLRLMLDLNIMGPNGTDFDGAGLTQISALLNYTAASGPAVWAWEIGNENNEDLDAAEAARPQAARPAWRVAEEGARANPQQRDTKAKCVLPHALLHPLCGLPGLIY